MKKILVIFSFAFFLTGFISAIGMTGSAVDDNAQDSDNSSSNGNQIQAANAVSAARMSAQAGSLGAEMVRNIIKAENRLRVAVANGTCPSTCRCNGTTVRCPIENGREMTIDAGKSGNTIIQVKNTNASTQVTLYKAEGKVYGVFKNNETKVVRMMPDQVQEKIRERLNLQDCSCEIALNDEGNYQVQTKKSARLFGFIPVKETVRTEINSETGETIRVRNSWWGFLASNAEEEPVLGASCATVTPGYNDECCQSKGYEYWDSEKSECLFYADE